MHLKEQRSVSERGFFQVAGLIASQPPRLQHIHRYAMAFLKNKTRQNKRNNERDVEKLFSGDNHHHGCNVEVLTTQIQLEAGTEWLLLLLLSRFWTSILKFGYPLFEICNHPTCHPVRAVLCFSQEDTSHGDRVRRHHDDHVTEPNSLYKNLLKQFREEGGQFLHEQVGGKIRVTSFRSKGPLGGLQRVRTTSRPARTSPLRNVFSWTRR